MDTKSYFTDVEKTVRDRGLTMSEFYELANIHQTTWMRMKGGQGYRSGTRKKIEAAVKKIERRKVRAVAH